MSFLPQLHGNAGNPRETIFGSGPPKKDKPIRFVRNKRWKLYGDGNLFEVENDVLEKSPVTSAESAAIRKKLQTALEQMPAKGQTLLKFE